MQVFTDCASGHNWAGEQSPEFDESIIKKGCLIISQKPVMPNCIEDVCSVLQSTVRSQKVRPQIPSFPSNISLIMAPPPEMMWVECEHQG